MDKSFYHKPEYREKQRLSHLGKQLGKDNPNYKHGKSCGVMIKLYGKYLKKGFNSESGKSTRFKKGENHPNWKGGKTKIRDMIEGLQIYKKWRQEVFKRDNFTCKKCSKRGGVIHPHHIIPFAVCIEQKRYDMVTNINNGVTLCFPCHKINHIRGIN